jgi:ABC-type transport system substrate-binding protein
VGLKMEFEVSTWPELLKKSRAGTLMMWGYAWSAGSPDGGFFLAIAYGPNASESNDPRFALPAFDRLFERQRVLPDGPEREP